MKIVVLGTGYVGLACLGFLQGGHDVVGVDIDAQKIDQLNRGELPIHEPGLAELMQSGKNQRRLSFTTDLTAALKDAAVCFICVGTPAAADGSTDLQYIDAAATAIKRSLSGDLVVVNKSTVPVGTAQRVAQIIGDTPYRVSVVSNPEFLREGSALKDFLQPDRIVFGTDDAWAEEILLTAYQFTPAPKIRMPAASAELTKYAANAFLATKLSFMNEMAGLCDAYGADIRDVTRAMGHDPRIGSLYLNAGLGFGGGCFPKDLASLSQMASSAGQDFALLREVVNANEELRQRFVNRVVAVLGDVRGKRLVVWGLAFKAGTDDVRQSPAIDIVERLLALGANITVFDRLAADNARKILGDRVSYASSPSASLSSVASAKEDSALLILTADPHVKTESINTFPPFVFDGWNVLADRDYASANITYVGIGLGRSF